MLEGDEFPLAISRRLAADQIDQGPVRWNPVHDVSSPRTRYSAAVSTAFAPAAPSPDRSKP